MRIAASAADASSGAGWECTFISSSHEVRDGHSGEKNHATQARTHATLTITKITGSGAAGTTANVTLTDAASHLSETLHLENTFAHEFGTSASDYVLTHVTPIVGMLFELG